MIVCSGQLFYSVGQRDTSWLRSKETANNQMPFCSKRPQVKTKNEYNSMLTKCGAYTGPRARVYKCEFDGVRRLASIDCNEDVIVWDIWR